MARPGRIASSALSVAAIMLLSEAVAYVGDLTFASHYGATAVSDAYIAANGVLALPLMLLGACAAATFIPFYMQRRAEQADLYASNVLGTFALVACAVCAALMLFSGPLVRLMHPGFDAARVRMTAEAARIMLPALPFMVVAMLLSSLLEAHDRFAVGQLAVFPRSILLIAACLLFSGGRDIRLIAWSVLAAGVVQAALLIPFARRAFCYTPRIDLRAPYLRTMTVHALPALLGMGANQFNQLTVRAIASGLRPGDITAMSFSMQLVMLLGVVFTVPMTTVLFPHMSRQAARADYDAIGRTVSLCTRYTLLLITPIVVVGCVLHEDVIRLAYGRGMFSDEAVRVTAAIFLMQLPGALGLGARMLFTSAFHACLDTKTPLYITCVMVTANILLCVALTPRMGVRALALAGSVAGILGAAVMAVALGHKLKRAVRGLPATLLKAGLSGAMCLLVTLFIQDVLPAAASTGALIVRIGACAAPALLCYALCLYFLGVRAPLPDEARHGRAPDDA